MITSDIQTVAIRLVSVKAAEVWGRGHLEDLGTFVAGTAFPLAHQGEQGKKYLFCKVGDMNRLGNEVEIVGTANTIDEDVARELGAKPLPIGTVVFPKIGGAIATNKRRIIVRDTIVDNNVMGIAPAPYTATKWLYYLLRGIDLSEYQSGTSVPALKQSVVARLEVPLIPLEYQFQISVFLDWLSKRTADISWDQAPPLPKELAEQRRVVERIEQLATKIHEAHDLRHQATEEAETLLQSDLSARLARAEENFGVRRMGDVTKCAAGFGFPKQYQGRVGLKYPFAKVSDMNLPENERAITTAQNWVGDDDVREMGLKIYPVGTIIFPKIGGAIATNKRRVLALPATFDNNIMGLIPSEDLLSDYLFSFMQSFDLTELQAGTSVPAISQGKVEELKIPVPPLPDQRRIVAYLDDLHAKVNSLKELQAQTAAELDALLPSILDKAFKGEL